MQREPVPDFVGSKARLKLLRTSNFDSTDIAFVTRLLSAINDRVSGAEIF